MLSQLSHPGAQWGKTAEHSHCSEHRDTLPRGRPGSSFPWPALASLTVCAGPLSLLQDVQSKLKESAQCVGDEFVNCKLAARAKVLVSVWSCPPPPDHSMAVRTNMCRWGH